MTTGKAKGIRRRGILNGKDTYDRIFDSVKAAPRDAHGVFYNPQGLCQEIAELLDMPAPGS